MRTTLWTCLNMSWVKGPSSPSSHLYAAYHFFIAVSPKLPATAMTTNYTIVGFGECNLDTCGMQQSLFGYRPSLTASGIFIALFGISLVIHLAQAFRSQKWTFGSLIVVGCAVEMIGYGGRVIMNHDPWSFAGFMLQIGILTIVSGCELD